MTPAQRHEWIAAYLRERSVTYACTIDVLDAYFVDAYLHATKPTRWAAMPYGAHRVPQLGRDLSAMHNAGQLTRSIAGTGDMRSMGFPSWVWCYRLTTVNSAPIIASTNNPEKPK